jgi:hypothetical protein
MNIMETESAESGTRLRRADHAGAAYDADIAECRKVLSERGPGLVYVAHVTSGILDFALDVPGPWPGAEAEDMTEARERAGRQLSLSAAQLDSACEPLDSGTLIRLVIQGENGALFQVLKVAGQSFFGLTLDGTPVTVDRADRQLARLAESAARRVGATSLLWGGFRNREDSGELWRPYEAESPAQARRAPYASAPIESSVTGSVTDVCRDALHRDDLHFIGIFRHGEPAWCADVLDDASLAPFFQRVTPESRRRGYDRVIRVVNMHIRRFSQLLTLVRSHQLVRLVLDVARGAIYVFPLNDDEQLVGVTLIQSRVEQADQKMRAVRENLVPAIAPARRLPS